MNLEERISLMDKLAFYLKQEDNEELNKVKQKAWEKNKWFTPAFIDQAIRNIADNYLDGDALRGWVRHYRLDDNVNPQKVGVVMAGNIPLVGFHDFLSVFMSGHILHIKLSEKDEVLLKHIVDKLTEWEPGISEVIKILPMLKGCDAYIATGSQNSSRYFNYYFGKFPSIIRSNKTSVAILTGKESRNELELLADDVYAYFGLGCRNVTKVYVPDGYDFVPLLDAFKKYNYLADETKYKNNYDYNLALLIMNNKFYMSNESIVLVENDNIFSPVSVLHYSFYDNLEDIRHKVPLLESVQCVVGTEFVPWGHSQAPSLFDYADGVDTMQFLLGL